MADNPGPGVTFGRIAAAVPVRDISQALGFYQGILGMSVTFTNGDPVGFVILRRDADYGLRGFVMADPDGNRIDVGQRLTPR